MQDSPVSPGQYKILEQAWVVTSVGVRVAYMRAIECLSDDRRLVRFALEDSTTKWQLCFLSHSRSLPLAHFLSFKVTELLTVGACRVVRTVRDG